MKSDYAEYLRLIAEYQRQLAEESQEPDLREVTLILDEKNYRTIEALADRADGTFDFVRIEVI